MAQITWRADYELIDRVKCLASREGQSLNAYVTRVLNALTNPDLAGDDLQKIRERLARAGLLASNGAARVARPRPDPQALAKAREAAGRGTNLSDLIVDGRG
ncbi:MAG: transcriptional regulator [Candidatus Dormibacteraceae bacterium]